MKTDIKELFEGPGFAEEYLAAKIQSKLQEVLDDRGLSRSDLARRMNVSKARVSQIFADDANFTVKTLARACHALNFDATCMFSDLVTGVKSARDESSDGKARARSIEVGADEGLRWQDAPMAFPDAWNLDEFTAFGAERPARPGTRAPKQGHSPVGSIGLSAANDWSAPVALKKSPLMWN
jgi:transcriptional regulator with XRE-family HTH domain